MVVSVSLPLLSLSLCLGVSLSLSLCLCPSVGVHVSVRPALSLSLSVSVSLCLSVCLHLLLRCLYVCAFVCVWIRASVYTGVLVVWSFSGVGGFGPLSANSGAFASGPTSDLPPKSTNVPTNGVQFPQQPDQSSGEALHRNHIPGVHHHLMPGFS